MKTKKTSLALGLMACVLVLNSCDIDDDNNEVVQIAVATSCNSPRTEMVGAFDKSTKLTVEEDSLFKAVVLSHEDLQLKPLKVSRQVVAGTNYRYECVDVTTGKKVEVVVYQPLPGAGEASILSINGEYYMK